MNLNENGKEMWSHYEGEFVNDMKHGFGSLYMCNGDKVSGQFMQDCLHGYATFTHHAGKKVSGMWNNNVYRP